MNLLEAVTPYRERYEKYEKKKASIARLEKQVGKIDISYKTLATDIAKSLMSIIPGAIAFEVMGPFGLRGDMGLYIDCHAGGVFFRKCLHFTMRSEEMCVTVYPDDTEESKQIVWITEEDNLSKVVDLMYNSYTAV